ncbi:uncharacterized protein LOC119015884 isoform X2 [Acanthopagrus latus]|uniref:uncharacterized protein LOC119015884 isoform X2 n=1 Tax=Acanthopagrus latus TaxID=8177 RepID=UPI00187C9EF4|nr:uncharacterized protein LOC119015884 isoform X2 [Acanthopagrus latus]
MNFRQSVEFSLARFGAAFQILFLFRINEFLFLQAVQDGGHERHGLHINWFDDDMPIVHQLPESLDLLTLEVTRLPAGPITLGKGGDVPLDQVVDFQRYWLLECGCRTWLLQPESRPWLLECGGSPRISVPQYCRVSSRRSTYVARQKWRRHWPVRCGELSPCRKWPGRCTVLPPPCLCHAIPAGIIGTSPPASVPHFSPHTVHVEKVSSRCMSE